MMTNRTISGLNTITKTGGAEVAVALNGANYNVELGEAAGYDVASEADVLAGTAADSLVTPAALRDVIAELRKELGAFYSDWTLGADTQISTTHGATTLIPQLGGTSILTQDSASVDVTTLAVSSGPVFALGNTLGMPQSGVNTDAFTGTIRGGLVFVDGNNVRWFVPTFHPLVENPQSEGNDICFYWDAGGPRWAHVTYKSGVPQTSIAALPDDNAFYLVSPAAHDDPSGAGTNVFRDEFLIGRRAANDTNIMRVWYDSNASQSKAKAASRVYELPIRKKLFSLFNSANGVAPNASTTYTLTGGLKFSDVDFWYVAIGGASGNTSPDSVSAYFPGGSANLIEGTSHLCMTDCSGNTNRIEVLSDTTFKYAAGGTNSKLYSMTGHQLA